MGYGAFLKRQPRDFSERVAAMIAVLQSEHGWTMLHDGPTMRVLAAPGIPRTILPGNAGVIVGHIFDRNFARVGPSPVAPLDEPARLFVERYWGGYVALRTSVSMPEIVRDPSGTVPCYHFALDEIHIVTSRPELLLAVANMRPELDWTIVTQAIVYRDLRPSRTCLRGMSELLPGMTARLFPTGLETSCAWSPWDFVQETPESADFDTAAAMVGSTARNCLAAWCHCFEHPLVEISGGLDSAIVAAGLAQIPRQLTALTYAAIAGDPDETPYAHAVADHLGLALRTGQPSIDSVDLFRSDARDLPRPSSRNFSQAFDRIAASAATEVGTDVFFSGGGGDNVFCYQRSLSPVRDRIRRRGLEPGLVDTIREIAALGETSIWHVGARVIRRMLSRRPAPVWTTSLRFLRLEALEALPLPFGHPWLAAPTGALPGKHAHVKALISVQNHFEGHARLEQAQIIFPLLSQPLMEVCLSVPTWLWCTGGRNRAVARAAFAGTLPASIIQRQSKGAFDSFAAQLLSARLPELRSLLLDGILVRQKILDKEAVEQALTSPTLAGEEIVDLWRIADVEAWARGWRIRADRTALS